MAAPALDYRPRRLRRPTQHTWNGFLGLQRERAIRIIDQLARGKIDPREFGERLKKILVSGHADAWALGRMRAGDLSPFSIEDHLRGLGIADGDDDFLLGFVDDLVNGKGKGKNPVLYRDEDGNWQVQSVAGRTGQYLYKFRGTANEAFTQSGADTDEYAWKMGAKEHCEDCPQLEALNPYTKDTMMHQPGDGSTECNTNCGCYWVNLTTGVQGFKKASLAEVEPAPYDVGRPGDLSNIELGPETTPRAIFDLDRTHLLRGEIEDALAVAGRVHSVPLVDEIPILEFADNDPRAPQGAFGVAPGVPETADVILNIFARSPRATFLHELGHIVDIYFAGKLQKTQVRTNPLFSKFRKAVLASEAYKRLKRFVRDERIEFETPNGWTGTVPIDEDARGHARYLRHWFELWARAYFQFIAVRGKDEDTLEALRDLQAIPEVFVFGAQWSDEDFKEIEAAIEDILTEMGLM